VELYEEVYQESSGLCHLFCSQTDGVAIGKLTMICYVKGTFNARTSLLRYIVTWNIETVLHYLEGLGASTEDKI